MTDEKIIELLEMLDGYGLILTDYDEIKDRLKELPNLVKSEL